MVKSSNGLENKITSEVAGDENVWHRERFSVSLFLVFI